MSISAVSGYTTTASSSTLASATQSASQLQSEFLTMLMAELKNQDPSNPVDDTQMISQQAQLSTLEEMQSLNSNMTSMMDMESTSQAVNLVGKTVTGTVSGSSVSGLVSGVSFVCSETTSAALSASSRSTNLVIPCWRAKPSSQ